MILIIKYIDLKEKNSYNIYVYCNNNPVMYEDPEGNVGFISALLIGAIVGVAAQAITDTISNAIQYKLDFSNWQFSS